MTKYIVLFFLFISYSFSQQTIITPNFFIGGIAGYQFIQNYTTMPVIPGTTDCASFAYGSSNGFFGGITFDYSLLNEDNEWKNVFEVSSRLLFSRRGVDLQTFDVNSFQVLSPITGTYVPFQREHTFEGSMSYLIVDLGFKVYPLRYLLDNSFENSLPLYLRFSGDVGLPLFGTSYEQYERIRDPEGVFFPDSTRSRLTGSGAVVGTGSIFGFTSAIGYELPLSKDLFAYPELSYRLGLNSIVNYTQWNSNSVALGIGIRWMDYNETEEKIPDPPPIIEEEKPAPIPVVISNVASDPLEIQQTVITQTFPLLPYVFFEKGKSDLKSKYNSPVVSNFDEKSLPKETLTIYYSLLQILGNRLKQYPKSTIIITGTTESNELPTQSERLLLATQRANRIKRYFTDNFGVDENRIIVQARELPELETSERYVEGAEENRRVEITSNEPSILAPVVHSRFMEYEPKKSIQQFRTKLQLPTTVKNWNLKVLHKGNVGNTLKGEGNVPELLNVNLSSAEMLSLAPKIDQIDSLEGVLEVQGENGELFTGKCVFPIVKTDNTFELSRLSLIVFDFDKSEITETNKSMMKNFIQTAVKPGSIADITGSTDKLGEVKYNSELSQQRANVVSEYIKKSSPDLKIKSIKGLGSSILPYDNALPEGRYYCRTVSILITSPVSK